jgi:exopolysaccharide production protein ExoZ
MRFESIQFLRFIAAFMVLICHSFFYTSERLGVDNVSWGAGSRGVDIFFIISGFVMIISSRKLMLDTNGWKTFAWKRLIRIVPLYWSATSLKLIVSIALSGLVLHAEPNFWLVFKSYFFIPSLNIDGEIKPFLGVGWTLVFEMFFYVIFSLALFFRVNVYKFVGLALLLVSLLSLLKQGNESVWFFIFDSLVLEFYMGMVLAKLIIAKVFMPRNLSIIIFPMCMTFLLISENIFGLPKFIHDGIPSFFLVYSAVSLEISTKVIIPKIFVFLGAASYSIYLFHPLIAPIVPELLKRVGLNNIGFSILFTIIFALVLTSFIHKYYEQPISRLLSKY